MFFSFFNRFFIFLFLITNVVVEGALFEGMKTGVNKKLIVAAQKIPNRSKTHQLQYSVFSQLQNVQKYQDVINTIDLIATQIKKEQNAHEEITMLFSTALVSSALSLVAKKLYFSIAKLRSIISYWKKIDDYSVLRYVITHAPKVWDVKLQHDFQIKQKIMAAENLCKKYISYLGRVSQLTQQMPSKIIPLSDNILWINEALSIMSTCSGQQCNKISLQDDFNARKFLYDFRLFLETFEVKYDEKFQKEKKSIMIPSYATRSFGKIFFTTLSLIGTGLFVWYKYAKIGEWWNKGYSKISDLVQKNIVGNVKTVYDKVFFEKRVVEQSTMPQKIDSVDFNTAYDELINEFKKLNQQFIDEVKKWTPSDDQQVKLKQELVALIGENNDKFTQQEMDEVIKEGDVLNFIDKAEDILWSTLSLGKTGRVVKYLPAASKLVVQHLPKHLYNTLEKLTKLLGTSVEIVQAKDKQINDVKDFFINKFNEKEKVIDELLKEIDSLRLLALLTPTVFTAVGSTLAIKKIYNFFTNRDYSILKRALKELETVAICSIKTPNNHENYGMFVFLLENLKLGVARISNSRYTRREELLEDLKRLDLSDLSFKERHKLILQIKESYIIFK